VSEHHAGKMYMEIEGKTPLVHEITPDSDLGGLTIKSRPGNRLPLLKSFVVSFNLCK
jgi:hypothetical protein